jgi:uncharacterized protein
MHGVSTPTLVVFLFIAILIELIFFHGLKKLFGPSETRAQFFLRYILLFIGVLVFGIFYYSYSDQEKIRWARDYSLFYFIIGLSALNLVPKFFFVLLTLLSYFFRLFFGRFGQRIVLCGATLISFSIFLIILYGIFFDTYQLRIQRQDLFLDGLPQQLDGFKIVQISDLHLASFRNHPHFLQKTGRLIDGLNPDLLLFTGDIVNNYYEEYDGFAPYLQNFKAKYGKFAILGNHDYGDYSRWSGSVSKQENFKCIQKGLTDCGFVLLLNSWQRIGVKDTSFVLIGVENWGRHKSSQYANLQNAMKGIPSNSFQLLMSHDPAYWETTIVSKTTIPLTLSGHTHGGQIGIKIAGIEFSPMLFLERCWGGLYQSNNQYLYVNRGLGTVGLPARIEMKPEITLLTLHQSKCH